MKEGIGNELLNTCSLCLSSNKRTINILHTYLQSIYEKLIKYKIEDDAHLCFICHRRLQQCSQFVTLAKKTQILRETYKRNIKMEEMTPPTPLVQLTKCTVMNFGVPCFDSVETGEPQIKEEPESDEDIEENCEDDDESQEHYNIQNSESEDSLPKKVTKRKSLPGKQIKKVKQNKKTKK